MIKVECTACKNPYELDEKRLPKAGLRMRCPKCGVSFLVFPDGRTEAAPAVKPTLMGTGLGPPPPPGGLKKPIVPPPAPIRTEEEAAAPVSSAGAFRTVPSAGVKKVTGPGGLKKITGSFSDDDVDLPAPVGAGPRPGHGPLGEAPKRGAFADDLDPPAPVGAKPKPAAKPVELDDLDLPAPRRATPLAAAPPDDLDLPSPRGQKPAPPPRPLAPVLEDELDLPARGVPKITGGGVQKITGGVQKTTGAGVQSGVQKTTGAGVQKITGGVDLPALRPPQSPRPPQPAANAGLDDLDLPAPRGASKAGSMDDLDLPAPRGAKAAPLDVDLPAPRANPAALEFDLPAPRARAGAPMELDLPAPRGKATPMELDLPAPRGKAGSLDLDLPTPRAKTPAFDLDLPAPRGASPDRSGRSALASSGTPFDDLDGAPATGGGFELDLPTPRKGGASLDVLDLPAPRGDLTDLPAMLGEVDLPRPSFGGLDLPAPRGAADLPAVRGAADLPAVRGAADLPAVLGSSDLPSPRGASDLPASLGIADLPGGRAVPKRTAERAAFDLPIPGSGPSLPPDAFGSAPGRGPSLTPQPTPSADPNSSFGELELPLPEGRRAAEAPIARGHGEVDLPGGGDGTEFSDLPLERQSLPPAGGVLPARVLPKAAPAKVAAPPTPQPGRARRNGLIAVGAVVLVGAAGAALTLTPYGPFGYYVIEQFLPGAGNAATVASVIADADQLALLDSYSASHEALSTLADARHDAGLNRALLSRSLLHECMHDVRWDDSSGSARAAAIRQRLEERGTDGPEVALALAADQLREGHHSAALGLIDRARAFAPEDPFVDLVEAEAALGLADRSTALQAFQQALAHGGGARAQWGIARALSEGGEAADIDAAVEATLGLSPNHGDALLRRGRSSHERGDDEAALADIAAVIGAAPFGEPPTVLVSPPRLRGEAWALAGDIHESAGRLHQALEAFAQASDADPARVDAALGAGRVLLVDRPGDALTRFESVIERADANETILPSGRSAAQEARLGAARAMLDLDRDQEARSTLENLVAELPEDPEMVRWLGRSHELLDEPEAAEQNYRESIRLAPTNFDGYLFLARLLQGLHRDNDAVNVLEQARSAVPESAEMREGLGTYELGLNRLPEAINEFRRALVLDEALPAARFGLGQALRRSGDFDGALAAFEELARLDPGHPGMALERGLLFEARGESDRAVEYYTQALAEDPENPELLLRLGAAQVGAGDIDAAEESLTRVQTMLPASAEAEHFVGRIAFARHNYAEAVSHFERAISLDASRGEFFVYAAWAALETNDIGDARSHAEAAIARDPSLGDAYWIRGAVRRRSGQARDAVVDLNRALTLRPTRYEALFELALCYDELRQLPQAIDALNRAVTAVDTNGEWWYRLGRLNMDADHAAEGARTLGRATLIGEATTPSPFWLADAHRILGDAQRLLGDRAGAVEHYRRYLELAPPNAVDRREVRSALLDLGSVPPEE